MKKLKFLFVICSFAVCFSFSSCQFGKDRPIGQLEELTQDIREHHKEYTVAEWKEAYATYEQIAKDMEQYNYSDDEMKKIGQLEGECIGYFVKSTVLSVDGLTNEINGLLDGLGKSIGM